MESGFGDGGDSQSNSPSKQRGEQSVLPVTIKQITEAELEVPVVG